MSAALIALWLLPLLGAIMNWSCGPQLRRMSGVAGSAVVGVSLILTLLLWGTGTHAHAGLFRLARGL